jgi:hypothetical protein
MEKTLTMAYPIETEKIRTHHAKIVVECTTGKPYYSIEWFDPAKNEYYLGYSSYSVDNVTGWLSEYFEIVEKPKTNADRIRAMSDEELAEDFCKTVLSIMEQLGVENTGSIEDAVRVRLEWLKQPTKESDKQ